MAVCLPCYFCSFCALLHCFAVASHVFSRFTNFLGNSAEFERGDVMQLIQELPEPSQIVELHTPTEDQLLVCFKLQQLLLPLGHAVSIKS